MTAMVTSKVDTSRLEGVLRASLELLDRTAESLVAATTIFFVQSGRKLTKRARKGAKRDLIPNPPQSLVDAQPRSRFLQGGDLWAIILRKQNKPNTFILTNDKNDARRKVPNVGASKNSWSGMLKGLNKSAPMIGKGVGRGLGNTRRTGDKKNPEFTLTSFLSYLPIIAPNVDEEAIEKATNRMEHNLDRQVGKKLKRMWS